ncbi:MAG: PRC-barrel domain-containing protein [Planctomycetota bacterium]
MAFQFHAIVLLASLPAAAWQDAGTTRPKQAAPGDVAARQMNQGAQYVSLDEILKAEVMIQGDMHDTAARTPADREKKDAKPERSKGKLKEIVIARDGRMQWAVLSTGGLLGMGDKEVLVPFSSLAYTLHDDNKAMFHLKMSEAELKALPEFDASKAEKDLDAAIGRVNAATNGSGKDDTKDDMNDAPAKESAANGAMATSAGPRYVYSSRLKSAKLVATDKDFGKIDNAVIDVRRNRLDYVVASHGGALGMGTTLAIVPFQAVSWTLPANARDNDEWVLKINKTIEQLKTAPEYKKPESTFVSADQLKQSDAFFGTNGTRFD